jgi:hypothetical protein
MERVRYFLASHKKLVFACAAGVALLLVLPIVIKILFSARLYIMVAPENATVKINGKEYSNGEHKLMIGRKTVEISGEGFETEKTELNLGIFSNKTILRAYAVNGSYDYYKENANSYIILKHINSMDGNEETKAFVSKMEKAYKLKYELPLSNNFDNSFGRTAFSTITDATDEEECKALLCLRLDKTTNKAKEAMKERLAALGYNVEDYVIFYGELPEGEDAE